MADNDDNDGEERNMNDTTMPPPKSTGGTAVRSKVRLRKGFGLSDWTRLVQSSTDLAQRKGADLRRIRWDEIMKHNTIYDGWTVLKGKVYNISSYIHYHPGGEQILHKILGKDATALYERYHRWVNEENLIGKLHIGYLEKSPKRDDDDDALSYLPTKNINNGFAMPAPRLPTTIAPVLTATTSEEQDDEVEDLNPWEKPEQK